jgi:hypothetical protein
MFTKNIVALNEVAGHITTCFVAMMNATPDEVHGGRFLEPPLLQTLPLVASPAPPLLLLPPPPMQVPRIDNGFGAARQSPHVADQVSCHFCLFFSVVPVRLLW